MKYGTGNKLHDLLKKVAVNNCVMLCNKMDLMNLVEFENLLNEMSMEDIGKLMSDMLVAMQTGEVINQLNKVLPPTIENKGFKLIQMEKEDKEWE